MMPIDVSKPLLPIAVLRDARLRGCSRDVISIGNPNFGVDITPSRTALSIRIALLSNESMLSRGMNAIRGFLQVDDRSMLVNLPPRGHVSLTFLGVLPGVHHVRWGIFVSDHLLTGGTRCVKT